ncbi:MAG: GGDEF domain-containing protein [Armatimonadota bacterium]|nr:GGDEF domain-containing protein [Armatimonadota bacterium]
MAWQLRATRLQHWMRDRGTIGALLLALYALAFWLWQVFQWGGPETRVVIGDLAVLPGSLGAAVLAWRVGSHHTLDPRARAAWRTIGAAFFLYWFGDLLWAYYELILGIEPFPSAADAGYLLFYPLLLVGLLRFPVSRCGPGERLKFWLDAGTVVLSGWMVVWHLVLGPIALEAGTDAITTALSAAYPIGDLVMLFGIVAVVLRRPVGGNRHALMILAGGLLMYFVADLAYGYLTLLDRYQSGDWPDGLWMAAHVATAAAVVHQWRRASGGATAVIPAPRDREHSLLPYLAVFVGNIVLLVAARQQATALMGGLVFGAVGVMSLVMARQFIVMNENLRLMGNLHTLATTDSLTGLANRRHFFSLVADRSDDAERSGSSALMIDLDDFKDVNDRFGHETGDELLLAVAHRLRGCVRAADVVARLGGDEFAILLNGATAAGAVGVADRVIQELRRPFALRHGEVVVRASVGVATALPGRDDAEELLRHADLAMYAAKRRGKGRYEVFDATEAGMVPAPAS